MKYIYAIVITIAFVTCTPKTEAEDQTGWMYAISGLLVKQVYEKDGINGVKYLLNAGSTDEDFYRVIEEKLNVTKENFGQYIRTTINDTDTFE